MQPLSRGGGLGGGGAAALSPPRPAGAERPSAWRTRGTNQCFVAVNVFPCLWGHLCVCLPQRALRVSEFVLLIRSAVLC